MFLPLPRLDDRRWIDLVEDARAIIPLHAPEWTDHNVSDPGITFAELFAWIAEMQIFQVDQVPAAHRLKFLALAGIRPQPPVAARTVLRFGIPAGASPVPVPATAECQAGAAPGAVRYRTQHSLRVVPAQLAELRSQSQVGVRDLTDRWRRGEGFMPFEEDPSPGDALVLALDAGLPPRVPVSIAVRSASADAAGLPPEHHSARIAWEVLVGDERWRRLDPAAGEVADDTRALTSDGRVVVVTPTAMHAVPGPDGDRFLLRARHVSGAFDVTPTLLDIALNGALAEQSVPAGEIAWEIAAGARVAGIPQRGRYVRPALEVDADGRIARLEVTGGSSAPELFVLGYTPPAGGTTGSLTVEAAGLPPSRGAPGHAVTLEGAPVDAGSVEVWTLEGAGADTAWRRWSLRPDLDASGAADAHATLDPTDGTLRFGDGEHGVVPPGDAAIVATYRTTLADAGGVPAGAIDRLSDGAHNEALLSAVATMTPDVTNPIPGTGGAASETLEHAEGRALEAATATTRAVTVEDIERLAHGTPGVRLARVAARPNAHPGLPCIEAVGVITVLILPSLPVGRPAPSAAARRAVAAHLDAYRLAGTRIEVTGPVYTDVAVRARVRRQQLADPATLRQRITEALDGLFDPLRGGPDGTGWPFGRDVARSEVLQLIDEVRGVEHVIGLELVGPCGASCGDLCLGPLGLVGAREHEIEVVGP